MIIIMKRNNKIVTDKTKPVRMIEHIKQTKGEEDDDDEEKTKSKKQHNVWYNFFFAEKLGTYILVVSYEWLWQFTHLQFQFKNINRIA